MSTFYFRLMLIFGVIAIFCFVISLITGKFILTIIGYFFLALEGFCLYKQKKIK